LTQEPTPSIPDAEKSFLSLLEIHRRIDESFLQHQEALLVLDVELARARLTLFELMLVEHMTDEEKLMLPIFERAGPLPGCSVELFTGEHRRMLQFVSRFHEKLDEMETAPEGLKRKVLSLLDEEAMFKLLMEHHNSREETIFYPALDAVASSDEREELIARCLPDPPIESGC
jgi:hypothetical protein